MPKQSTINQEVNKTVNSSKGTPSSQQFSSQGSPTVRDTNPFTGASDSINTVDVQDVERDTKVITPPPVATPVADNFLTVQPEQTEPVEGAPTDTTSDGLASPSADNENLLSELESRREIFDRLGLSDITDTMQDLLKKGDRTAELEKREGIDDKTIAVNEIRSQIRAKEHEFLRARENVENQKGLSLAQKNVRLNNLSRTQARHLADLSIIEATRRDDLSTAQGIVDRKVDLEFEPLEQALKFQEFFFEQNKEIFSTLEQREFQKKLQDRQTEIDKDKFKFQQTENLKLELGRNMMLAGKSNTEIQNMYSQDNTADAIASAGSAGVDMEKRLRIRKLLNDLKPVTTTSPDGLRLLNTKDADKLNKEIFKTKEYKAVTGDSQKAIDSITEYEKIFNELGGAKFELLPSVDKERLDTAFTNVMLYAKNFHELGVLAGPDVDLLESALGGNPTGGNLIGAVPLIGQGVSALRENRRTKSINSAISAFKTQVMNGVNSDVSTLEGAFSDVSGTNVPALQTIRDRKKEVADSIFGEFENRVSILSDSQIERASSLADQNGVSVNDILMDNDLYERITEQE